MRLPTVVLVTDRSQLPPGGDLRGCVHACVAAGLAAVIVREHDLVPADRAALVEDLAAIPGLTVLSSRIPDPCAHGLHVSAAGPVPARGPWGRSCHSRGEVTRAAAEGADWVTLSPYAATPSKPGHGPALAPGDLAGHPLPVLALGGVHPGNAAAALDAGADGVAVMGAVMRSPEPGVTVSRLLAVTR